MHSGMALPPNRLAPWIPARDFPGGVETADRLAGVDPDHLCPVVDLDPAHAMVDFRKQADGVIGRVLDRLETLVNPLPEPVFPFLNGRIIGFDGVHQGHERYVVRSGEFLYRIVFPYDPPLQALIQGRGVGHSLSDRQSRWIPFPGSAWSRPKASGPTAR